MDSSWVDVTEPTALAELLDLDPALPDVLYTAIMRIPGSERWWTTRTVVVAPTTVNGEPVLGMQVLKTRVFFNLTEARKMGADVAVVGTAYALTTNLPLAGALGLVRKLVDNLTLLDEDERELVHVIMGLVPGNPYAAGVPEERIRAAYADATVDIDRLLDRLE